MGFAWSFFAAQSVMFGCCFRTGLETSSFLADETQLPEDVAEVVAVAAHDVMHFSNRHPDLGRSWMTSLEEVFVTHGVKSNPSKDIVGTSNCTCVGMIFAAGLVYIQMAASLRNM